MTPTDPLATTTTRDAFDRPDFWLSSPELAFASWIEPHQLKPDTKRVYIAMWSKFCRALVEWGVSLPRCQAHHISSFLDRFDDGRASKKEHRQRYVRLIERVYLHLIGIGLSQHNPGQQAAMARIGAGHNDPTRFLDQQEREALFAQLRGQLMAPIQEDGTHKNGEMDWTTVRDAAAAALMVGGGLKVSEVLHLTVNCTSGRDRLRIPASGATPEHFPLLLPIAYEAWDCWMTWRHRVSFTSSLAFPAAIDRRRVDQRVATERMHPATLYRRVHALLERAGIHGQRACCQTLRNTYTATLIEAGATDAELAECLGLFSDLSPARLREAYTLWDKAGVEE